MFFLFNCKTMDLVSDSITSQLKTGCQFLRPQAFILVSSQLIDLIDIFVRRFSDWAREHSICDPGWRFGTRKIDLTFPPGSFCYWPSFFVRLCGPSIRIKASLKIQHYGQPLSDFFFFFFFVSHVFLLWYYWLCPFTFLFLSLCALFAWHVL